MTDNSTLITHTHSQSIGIPKTNVNNRKSTNHHWDIAPTMDHEACKREGSNPVSRWITRFRVQMTIRMLQHARIILLISIILFVFLFPKQQETSTFWTDLFWTKELDLIRDDIPIEIYRRSDGQHSHRNKVAFTFDDGPNAETTPILLDHLERNGIYAVFFVVGVNLVNPDLIRLIHSKGHLVASHTFEHMNMVEKSDEEIMESLQRVEDIIRDATGKRPYLMRAPYGSINQNVRDLLRDNDYLHMRWDIDSQDWRLEGQSKEIISNVVAGAESGGIVLMHEQSWTTQLQPQLIQYLNVRSAKVVSFGEFLTKDQKTWMCQKYECIQEMKDPNSLFFNICKYNLQCN